MLRFNPRQRELFVDKIPDVANVAAASMFFGQFLSDRPFSVWLGLALFACLACWALAYLAAGGK
jgi:hypothetical protein